MDFCGYEIVVSAIKTMLSSHRVWPSKTAHYVAKEIQYLDEPFLLTFMKNPTQSSIIFLAE